MSLTTGAKAADYVLPIVSNMISESRSSRTCSLNRLIRDSHPNGPRIFFPAGSSPGNTFDVVRNELEGRGLLLALHSEAAEIGRAVQQECRDRSRMPSSA
eukprot:TRINITY_DN6171_c0_g1_i12.p1 TRINITY_DN6171_c0_g1~~TRINITY_DN6171_c0_g1_i12.p1  ORF type:complete len:100 (+),score=16.26 TRINITY_DN6171_c0_g1_i12:634-933(+)